MKLNAKIFILSLLATAGTKPAVAESLQWYTTLPVFSDLTKEQIVDIEAAFASGDFERNEIVEYLLHKNNKDEFSHKVLVDTPLEDKQAALALKLSELKTALSAVDQEAVDAAAATKLQSLARGNRDRARVSQMKDDAEQARREHAAIKLQSLARGKAGRKDAATRRDHLERERLELEAARLAAEAEELAPAVETSSEIAEFVAAEEAAQLALSAAQARLPQGEHEDMSVYLTRKRIVQREIDNAAAKLKEAQDTRKAAELSLSEPQGHLGQIASYSGSASDARMIAIEKAEAEIENRRLEVEAEAQAEFDTRDAATTSIQSAARGRSARRMAQSRRDELAAEEAVRVEAERVAQEKLAAAEREKAATAIQSAARGRSARRDAQSRRDDLAAEEAARVEAAEREEAATAIQSVARGRSARRMAQSKRDELAAEEEARLEAERVAQEKLAAEEAARLELERANAATAIQSAARGRSARRMAQSKRDKLAAAEEARLLDELAAAEATDSDEVGYDSGASSVTADLDEPASEPAIDIKKEAAILRAELEAQEAARTAQAQKERDEAELNRLNNTWWAKNAPSIFGGGEYTAEDLARIQAEEKAELDKWVEQDEADFESGNSGWLPFGF